MSKNKLKRKIGKLKRKLLLVRSDLLIRAEKAEYDANFAKQQVALLKAEYSKLHEGILSAAEKQSTKVDIFENPKEELVGSNPS